MVFEKQFLLHINLEKGYRTKSTSRLHHAVHRKMNNNTRATSQTLLASMYTLNVEVHESTIRRRLN